jgi:A/G-specific adenine glycosylase
LVAREHAGRLPEEPGALRELPGIGAYTAAAIASVAFGRRAAAVDGNVIRVIARIAGLRGRRNDPALRREVEAIAERLADGPSPADWTQALMELGAVVCLPRAPRCDACPASSRCAARESGDPAAVPAPARVAAPVEARRLVMLLARRRGRVLLVREDEGAGAWGLPQADAAEGEGRAAATRLSRDWMPGALVDGPKHRFRHRTYAEDLRYEVWEASHPRHPAAARAEIGRAERRAPRKATRWAHPARLDELPVRGPTLKALRRLRSP